MLKHTYYQNQKGSIYDGLLTARQKRDLESATDYPVFKMTQADRDRLEHQKYEGVSSCFNDSAFQTIRALGADYNTSVANERREAKREQIDFTKKMQLGSLLEYIEKKAKSK